MLAAVGLRNSKILILKMDNSTTAYILIGGQSSRMGMPKGNLKLNGMSFIEHINICLKPYAKNIYLVGDKTHYDHLGLERIPDQNPNMGPISGIYSALSHSSTNWNFILSCDIPSLKMEILEKLLPKNDGQKEASILKDKNRLHPLIGLYPKSAIPTVKMQIKKGDFKLLNLLEQLNFNAIEMQENIPNINTDKDYQKLKDEFEN